MLTNFVTGGVSLAVTFKSTVCQSLLQKLSLIILLQRVHYCSFLTYYKDHRDHRLSRGNKHYHGNLGLKRKRDGRWQQDKRKDFRDRYSQANFAHLSQR